MRGNLNQALENVDLTYQQIVEISNNIINQYTQEVNNIIQEAKSHIENMSNDYIRDLMLRLSLNSFCFSETKERSMLMSACAEIIRKESYAKEFNSASGTVGLKENTAIINTADEVVTEAVYSLVSSLLKTKLDEIHRVVDTLKTILMSRLSEAKLNNVADMTTND